MSSALSLVNAYLTKPGDINKNAYTLVHTYTHTYTVPLKTFVHINKYELTHLKESCTGAEILISDSSCLIEN